MPPQSIRFSPSEWDQRTCISPTFPGRNAEAAGQGYQTVGTTAPGNTDFKIEPGGPRPVYLPGKPAQHFFKIDASLITGKGHC